MMYCIRSILDSDGSELNESTCSSRHTPGINSVSLGNSSLAKHSEKLDWNNHLVKILAYRVNHIKLVQNAAQALHHAAQT